MPKPADSAPQVRVHVPTAAEDRPPWVKVGVIALVGFVVGVVWPRLAGIRPGPASPAESAANASASAQARASESAAPQRTPLAASAPAVPGPAPSASAAASTAPSPPSGPPTVTLGRGAVIACKNQDGESLKGAAACGGLGGLDALATPHLRKLAQCPAVEGQSGKVVMILNVDFAAGSVGLSIGKATTVPNPDGIATCMRPHAIGIRPAALAHEHPRYTVLYTAILAAGEASSAGGHAGGTAGDTPTAASSGAGTTASSDSPSAQVVWEVALVRDNPRTGQIVGRIQRGTRVRVSAGPQEGWYRIKYGGSASEGWVYRGAIGR
jgi:hypothetical protein